MCQSLIIPKGLYAYHVISSYRECCDEELFESIQYYMVLTMREAPPQRDTLSSFTREGSHEFKKKGVKS